jgi:hypothetical protein
VVFATAGVAIARQIVVQPRAVEVVTEMATDSDTVEIVKPNTTLEVLGESGKWLKVQTPSGKTGYVPTALVTQGSGGLKLSAITGGPSASKLSASNAGKGISPQAEKYAGAHGYRTEGPDRMTSMRQKYKADLKAFEQDGQVGQPK